MNKATIFDIQHCSLVDGPGIRTTVFFKGCNLHCAWCHNPESQSAKPQMLFYKDRCIGCGKCSEVCPHGLETCDLCETCTIYCPAEARKVCGKEYTADQVLARVVKDRRFYENSGGGVTFSGGECMLQIDFLAEILKKCKENGIHTAVDTAGHIPFAYFERILPYTDLFLYDIKLLDNAKHKKWTGAGNAQILSNLKRLFENGANIWIRIPIIPSINDSPEEMRKIKAFLKACGSPANIELLPYHAMGESKNRALGKTKSVFDAPAPEQMHLLREIFRDI